MKKQIRLCIVSSLFHPSVGGPGRQAVKFADHFFSKGGYVTIFCRKMSGLPHYDYNPNIKINKLWSVYPQVQDLEKKNFKNILISVIFSISLITSFIKRRDDYDIVHFFGAGLPLILSVLFLKLLGKKITATVLAANLGTEAGSLRNRYFPLGLLMTSFLKKVDFFIVMTEEIESGLLNEGFSGNNIVRIPNWVDDKQFYPVNLEERRLIKTRLGLNETVTALFVGRLVKRKGLDILVNACKQVTLKNPSFKLLIAGTGAEIENIMNMCRSLGIKGNISLLGHVHNIEDYLKVVDMFILPSIQEGMPNSLLEAMACRLPVIATRIGGVIDIVRDGENGLIVTPGNAEELKEAILMLIENTGLAEKIAENAYKDIKENYYIDSIVDKYVQLYRKLLEEA